MSVIRAYAPQPDRLHFMHISGQIIVNCVNFQARPRAGFPDKPETSFVIICEIHGNGDPLFASLRCVLCRIAPQFVPYYDAVRTKRDCGLVQTAVRLGTNCMTDFVNTFQTSRSQPLAKHAENRIFQREKFFL